jgi:hypothetical protein
VWEHRRKAIKMAFKLEPEAEHLYMSNEDFVRWYHDLEDRDREVHGLTQTT